MGLGLGAARYADGRVVGVEYLAQFETHASVTARYEEDLYKRRGRAAGQLFERDMAARSMLPTRPS